jgi:hypothetical protein
MQSKEIDSALDYPLLPARFRFIWGLHGVLGEYGVRNVIPLPQRIARGIKNTYDWLAISAANDF